MKHIAAVLLLALGNKEINEKNINAVLKSAGAKVDENCVKALVAACKGKNADDIIKEGLKKLAGSQPLATGAPGDKKEDKKDDKKGKQDEKKKEEKKKEEEKPPEDDDDDIGFGDLF